METETKQLLRRTKQESILWRSHSIHIRYKGKHYFSFVACDESGFAFQIGNDLVKISWNNSFYYSGDSRFTAIDADGNEYVISPLNYTTIE